MGTASWQALQNRTVLWGIAGNFSRGLSQVEGMTLGDCLEVLGGQEAGSVDLILTDPPWMVAHKYQGADISLNFGPWDQFKDEGP